MDAMIDEDGLPGSRGVVEWDWIYIGPNSKVLHAPLVWDDPHYEAYDDGAVTHCGRSGRGFIPGMFSRMGTPRCKRCCQKTGMPEGKGSPKNSNTCRPIVEYRIQLLKGEKPNTLLYPQGVLAGKTPS